MRRCLSGFGTHREKLWTRVCEDQCTNNKTSGHIDDETFRDKKLRERVEHSKNNRVSGTRQGRPLLLLSDIFVWSITMITTTTTTETTTTTVPTTDKTIKRRRSRCFSLIDSEWTIFLFFSFVTLHTLFLMQTKNYIPTLSLNEIVLNVILSQLTIFIECLTIVQTNVSFMIIKFSIFSSLFFVFVVQLTIR